MNIPRNKTTYSEERLKERLGEVWAIYRDGKLIRYVSQKERDEIALRAYLESKGMVSK